MQYGGTNRLHTSGAASREGERGRALPDILWRAAGVTTRPGSGLRLTVRHVEVPQLSGTLGMPPLTQQRTQSRLSRSEPCGRPLQLPTQRRSSLRDTRLLTRQQISPAKPHSVPPLSSSTAPKASRTMLPPLPAPAPCSEGPRQPEGEGEKEEDRTSTGGSSRSSSSSSLEDSEGDEVCEKLTIRLYIPTSCKFCRVSRYMYIVHLSRYTLRERTRALPADLGSSRKQKRSHTYSTSPSPRPPPTAPLQPSSRTTCS